MEGGWAKRKHVVSSAYPRGGQDEDAHDLPHTTRHQPLHLSAYLFARSSVLAHAVLAKGVPARQDHGDVHGAAVGLETNGAI